jgi:hypothetical protein
MSDKPAPAPSPAPPVKPKPHANVISSGFTPGVIKIGQPMSLAVQMLKKAGGIF